jgi:hypothetical protein
MKKIIIPLIVGFFLITPVFASEGTITDLHINCGGWDYETDEEITLSEGDENAIISIIEVGLPENEEEGPNEIVNGTFTGNADNWTLGTGWTYSDNQVLHTPGTSYSLTQDGTFDSCNVFTVMLNVGGSVGSVNVRLDNGTSENILAGSGNVVYKMDYANDNNFKIKISPSSDFNGTIDNVSVGVISNPTGNITGYTLIDGGSGYEIDSISFFDSSNGTNGSFYIDQVEGEGSPLPGISAMSNNFMPTLSGTFTKAFPSILLLSAGFFGLVYLIRFTKRTIAGR